MDAKALAGRLLGVGFVPRQGSAMILTAAHEDEAALEREALLGSRQAWDTLIRKHEQRVLVSILAQRVLLERARELVQDTWKRLLEHQKAGRLTQLKLPGLAIKQARFFVLQDVRERPGDDAVGEEELAMLESPEPNAEQLLVGREESGRVEAELARCPSRAASVFQFVRNNPDLSHAEVAKRHGLSVQRVRQILCEVRKRLRTAWENPDG